MAEIHGSEIELSRIVVNQGRHHLRLGNNQEGYLKNLREQVDAGVYNPPRHENIKSMQTRLLQLLSDGNTEESSDSDANEAKNDAHATDNSYSNSSDTIEDVVVLCDTQGGSTNRFTSALAPLRPHLHIFPTCVKQKLALFYGSNNIEVETEMI